MIKVMMTMAIKTILEISYIYPGNLVPAIIGSSKKVRMLNKLVYARLE